MRRSQDSGRNAAVGARRRTDGDAPHSGDLCGDSVHEQAGNERRAPPLTAGHIEPHAVHRQDALAEDAAVRQGLEPRFLPLRLVKATNVAGGIPDMFALLRRDGSRAAGDVHLGQAQGRFKGGTVKTAGIFQQGLVPAGTDIIKDGPYGALHVVAGIASLFEPFCGLGPVVRGLEGNAAACHKLPPIEKQPSIAEVLRNVEAGKVPSALDSGTG